jgi:hypothetical protein
VVQVPVRGTLPSATFWMDGKPLSLSTRPRSRAPNTTYRLRVSNPGSAAWERNNPRINRPAMISRSIETAACAPTKQLRSLERENRNAAFSSFKAAVKPRPLDRSAGRSPKRMPVVTKSANAYEKTRRSRLEFRSEKLMPGRRGVKTDSTPVYKILLVHIETARPIAPPSKERSRLSVSSRRITRARLPPRASRIAISRCRAAPRARSIFATLAQATSNTSPTINIKAATRT